jgi:uncharacterized membrane protein
MAFTLPGAVEDHFVSEPRRTPTYVTDFDDSPELQFSAVVSAETPYDIRTPPARHSTVANSRADASDLRTVERQSVQEPHRLSTASAMSSLKEAMSMFALEKALRSQVDEDTTTIARQALSLGVALTVPLLVGFCPIGFTWVSRNSNASFAIVSPLACASSVAVLVFASTLAYVHGGDAMRALFSLNYIVVLVSGILAGLTFVFEVVALETIGPTTLTVIRKTNILFGTACQTLVLTQCPKKDQIVSVFIVVGIGASFVLDSTAGDYNLRGSALGVLAALASACVGAMSDFLYEVGAQYCSTRSEVRGEHLRCLIAYQVAALLVYTYILN